MYLFAVASGAVNPFESGANAELNKQISSPLWAGIFVYASGLLGLLLIYSSYFVTVFQQLAASLW